MKIVFMGTPGFAVPCLKQVLEDGYEVAGVFTQPDKPQGRKMILTPPPVKQAAVEAGLPVYQPAKMRDGEALRILTQLAPDLIVVVAYGKILPKEILELPRLGCINVHGSLLPKFRGAGPIQWSVICGEAVTGVTTMFMAEGLDTGDMILKKEVAIGENETAGELYERMSVLGARCLSETLTLFASGRQVPREKQDDALSSYAPMLDKQLALLDYQKSALELHNLIRGLNPWPIALTYLDGKRLKVYSARPAKGFCGQAGALLDDKRMIIGCKDGAIEFLTVQPEGGKVMDAAQFMRGKRLEIGQKFTAHS